MNFSDEQLRQRYRFGRNSIMYLSDLLKDKIERFTRRKTSLTGSFFGFTSFSILTADDRKARCSAQLRFG